jgi:GR25 family glycosyltransferase involved in LPS biosynthesis
MKTIVLSLNTAFERRDYMAKILSEQNISFEFYDSLSPKDLDQSLLHNSTYYLSNEAIATFETHRSVLNHIKNDSDFTIILEDDATPIKSDIISKIENLLETELDWDIIFLGWIAKSPDKKIINQNFLKVNKFIGLHSYIVNPKSIDKVLSQLGKSTDHIDKRISILGNSNKLNLLFLSSKLFNQNTKFKTQIPKKNNYDKNISNRI